MFVDENFELSLKLGLLSSIGSRHARRHGRHVLYHHEAEVVTSPVEQIGLDFDLRHEYEGQRPKCTQASWRGTGILTCFRTVLNPSFFNSSRSKTIASYVGGV